MNIVQKPNEDNVVALSPGENEYNRIVGLLDSKIPADVVSHRDGGGGRTLDYLEGWYVIARLNEIFGQGHWSYTTEEMRLVHSGEVNGKQVAHYVARIRLVAFGTAFSDYGYGDGSDKFNPGKAHELAVKEAVTDGLKRVAKNFGMSMGLALYDKTKENVEDEEVKPTARAGNTKRIVSDKQAGVQDTRTVAMQPTSDGGEAKSEAGTGTKAVATRQETNDLIAATSRVIIKKGLTTVDSLKANLAELGVKTKEELTDEQAITFLASLRALLKG